MHLGGVGYLAFTLVDGDLEEFFRKVIEDALRVTCCKEQSTEILGKRPEADQYQCTGDDYLKVYKILLCVSVCCASGIMNLCVGLSEETL